jgi:hypothetical protein
MLFQKKASSGNRSRFLVVSLVLYLADCIHEFQIIHVSICNVISVGTSSWTLPLGLLFRPHLVIISLIEWADPAPLNMTFPPAMGRHL